MNNVVTGGAGFIGSHICEKLVKSGEEVICVDNFFTGKKENIKHLLDYNNFEIIRHDITDERLLLEADRIYHFACPASPVHYQTDPIKTIQTNVVGTNNMCRMAMKTKARILLASTSEVYGNPEVHPQVEDYNGNVNPTGPRSCYDEGKRCAETLMFDYYREKKVDIRVIRIFNTYGPKMSAMDGRVVSNFIVQALIGNPITIYGDGKQTRSFCYIDDLIHGIFSMMEQNKIIGPINLGNPEEKTILQLAKMILELTNTDSKIVYRDLPTDDPVRRKPNIDKAVYELGWKPWINLKDGLNFTIDYFRKILERIV